MYYRLIAAFDLHRSMRTFQSVGAARRQGGNSTASLYARTHHRCTVIAISVVPIGHVKIVQAGDAPRAKLADLIRADGSRYAGWKRHGHASAQQAPGLPDDDDDDDEAPPPDRFYPSPCDFISVPVLTTPAETAASANICR